MEQSALFPLVKHHQFETTSKYLSPVHVNLYPIAYLTSRSECLMDVSDWMCPKRTHKLCLQTYFCSGPIINPKAQTRNLGVTLAPPFLSLTSLLQTLNKPSQFYFKNSYWFTYQPCYTVLSCLDHCDSIQICVPTFTLVMLQSKFLIALSILLLKWKFYFALMQRTWLFFFSILAPVPNINKAQSRW